MKKVIENYIIGAQNLLINCANLKAGERLLIISERPDLGWYDGKTAEFIMSVARAMEVDVALIEVGRPENIRCANLAKMINSHDCTIFFSRIGDQDRFFHPKEGTRSVMCYIRDMDMLASSFGTTRYCAVRDLKNAIDDIFLSAKKIEIKCPLGTSLMANINPSILKTTSDVGVRRFPLGVATPVSASDFSGTLALDRYLAPTGSRVYDPPYVKLDAPVLAEIKMGRIIDFSGPTQIVKIVKEHYSRVAGEFDIDAAVVHSWHAGIHPGCNYQIPESDDPDRWSNTVFSDPKYVHFHTCGAYAPGEISCTIPDHTIKINGITLWNAGKLLPHVFEQAKDCLNNWPELHDLFGYSAA